MSSDRANNPQPWFRAAPAPGHACRGLVALTGFAALGLGLWFGGLGCKVCAPVGWFEGLLVEVKSPDGFADGTYEVAIEADAVPVVLAVEFKGGAPTCSTPKGQEGNPCASEVRVGRDRRLFASIEDSYSPQLVVNLYYADGGSLAGGPEVAHLRISRGGETLGDATFEPDCDVSTTARADLTLSSAGASSQP